MIGITDEIYEHIIYDGRRHVALAALEGMRERSGHDQRDVEDVRRDRMAGRHDHRGPRICRTHSARCTTSFRSAQRLRFRRPAPSRIACRDRITASSPPTTRRGATGLCKALWEIGFDFEAPEGAYYIMAGDLGIRRHRRRRLQLATWCARSALLPSPDRASSRTRPLGRPYVRFCFCKRDSTLDEAAQRLRKLRVIV